LVRQAAGANGIGRDDLTMVATLYDAKFPVGTDTIAPDRYFPERGMSPPDDFIISRSPDGSPWSRYSELAWNFSAYTTGQDGVWQYFDYWRVHNGKPNIVLALTQLTPEREKRVREIRWLMFVMIYLREGNALACSSLHRYCILVRLLARFSDSICLSVNEVLASKEKLLSFYELHPSQATLLAALLSVLKQLGPATVGMDVASHKTISIISKLAKNARSDDLQTPPIPTRIYSYLLNSLQDEVKKFAQILPRVLALLSACSKNKLYGRYNTIPENQDIKLVDCEKVEDYSITCSQHKSLEPCSSSNNRGEENKNFSTALAEHNLLEFWRSNHYPEYFRSLKTLLTQIMVVCSLQIQAFTGMRYDEVHTLPHFCLETKTINGNLNYIVNGHITKIKGGKIKRASWVTSESGMQAITLAQQISYHIYELAGDLPRESSQRVNSHHLFVTPDYCFEYLVRNKNKQPALDLSIPKFNEIRKRICAVITTEDVHELCVIDPDRAWTSEEQYAVGNTWPLRTHQLRRSLALYAQRSGLVTLPSLKRQLQHITRAMTSYYAKGSSFANDFFDAEGCEVPHFCEQWRNTTSESEYLSHKKNVEMADPTGLSGAYVLWFQRNIRDRHIVLDRAKTLKEYKQGKRAYRETFAGGCVKVGDCDRPLSDPMNLSCLLNDCANQVIEMPKFERLIRIQVRVVAELEKTAPQLPETRIERSVLGQMQDKFDSIVKSKTPISRTFV
jgi:hypothetical protein